MRPRTCRTSPCPGAPGLLRSHQHGRPRRGWAPPGPGASPPAPGPAAAARGGALPPRSAGRVPSRAAQRGAGFTVRSHGSAGSAGSACPSRNSCAHAGPAAARRPPLLARLRAAPPRGPRIAPRSWRCRGARAAPPAGAATDLPPLRPRRRSLGPRAAAPLPAPLTAGPRALRGRQADGGCGRGRDPGSAAAGRRGRHFAVPIPAMGLPEVCRAGPGPRPPPRVFPGLAPQRTPRAQLTGPLRQAVRGQPLSVQTEEETRRSQHPRPLRGHQCSAMHVPENSSWT